MGPHSSECGNTVPPDSHGLVAEASMGPHSSECGNMPRSCSSDAAVSLQWGRTHLSAETDCSTVKRRRFPSLQWGRTHLSAETRLRAAAAGRHFLASMGPHSSECGNTPVGSPDSLPAYRFNGAALI